MMTEPLQDNSPPTQIEHATCGLGKERILSTFSAATLGIPDHPEAQHNNPQGSFLKNIFPMFMPPKAVRK